MNILSLFDGISCGRQALERSGIKVDNYFASEIDKYAIKVTMNNYPDTIQLGSVVDVDGHKLPKIDLLIGGSPCQSFSFAGKRNGMSTKTEVEIHTLEHYLQLKDEKYVFEGQSYLFWEYMRLLNEVKPKYFLLENVEMGEKWEKVLSRAIGVNGLHLNSSLVSAQNRSRIYWTNIGLAPQGLFGDLQTTITAPKDKKIMLKDILLNDVEPKYYLSENMTKNMVMKSNENASIIGHSGSGGQKGVIHNVNNKCTCLCATDYAQPKQIICHNLQRRNPDRPSTLKNKNAGGSGHLSKSDGKSYCLDAGQSNAIEINVFDGYNNRMRTDGKCGSITQHCSRQGLTNGFKVIVPTNDGKTYCLDAGQSNAIEIVGGVYRTFKDKQGFLPFADDGKCPTLLARARQDGSGQNAVEITTNNKPVIRRLTPIECERLQTIKDNYTDGISDSQRYKCLGNGWTIDIIAYIFSYIK